MRVLGINCSPRKGGNTEFLIKEVFKPIEERGHETILFQLGGKDVKGCKACMACRNDRTGHCVQDNKAINECILEMMKADAIIIGTPTYFTDITTEAKALMDVAGYVLSGIGTPLKRKVGAAVVAVRRAGSIHAFDTLNHFFLIKEMLVPGSTYWNMAFGRNKGEVANDAEGMNTMKSLGENIAWLMERTQNKD